MSCLVHGRGSRAAIAYCSLFPERVISAALFDASCGPVDGKAQREGARKAVAAQQKSGIERFPLPDGFNSHQYPDAVEAATTVAGKFDQYGALAKLTMPVLVATGDHDPNLEYSREIVERVPGARVHDWWSWRMSVMAQYCSDLISQPG